MARESSQSIGPYDLGEQLGVGGMGFVYRAEHRLLRQPRAVKILQPHLAADETFLRMFYREARLAASLDHPNIVPVYDVGQADGQHYLAMALLDGRPLNQLLRASGPLPPDRAARVVRQLADALQYAHDRNILHRDVKPANVFVDADDHVTLLDFGIARAMDGTWSVSGLTMGTVAYMAPELFDGRPADVFSDGYALAILAFELLVGKTPFGDLTPPAMGYAHVHTPPPPVRSRRPELPETVERVIARELGKEPYERYGNVSSFADALVPALEAASLLDSARTALAREDVERADWLVQQASTAIPRDPTVVEVADQVRDLRSQLTVRANVTRLLAAGDWRGATAELDRLPESANPAFGALRTTAEALRRGETGETEIVAALDTDVDRPTADHPTEDAIDPPTREARPVDDVGPTADRELQLVGPRQPRGGPDDISEAITPPEFPGLVAAALADANNPTMTGRDEPLTRSAGLARFPTPPTPVPVLATSDPARWPWLVGAGVVVLLVALSWHTLGTSTVPGFQPVATSDSQVASVPGVAPALTPTVGPEQAPPKQPAPTAVLPIVGLPAPVLATAIAPNVVPPAPAAPAVVAFDPDQTANPDQALAQAHAALDDGRLDDARRIVDDLRVSAPTSPAVSAAVADVYTRQAQQLAMAGHNDDAIAAYDIALKTPSRDDDRPLIAKKQFALQMLWNLLDVILGHDDDLALKAADVVFTVNPDFREIRPRFYALLVKASDRELDAGDRPATIASLSRAYQVNPNGAEVQQRFAAIGATPTIPKVQPTALPSWLRIGAPPALGQQSPDQRSVATPTPTAAPSSSVVAAAAQPTPAPILIAGAPTAVSADSLSLVAAPPATAMVPAATATPTVAPATFTPSSSTTAAGSAVPTPDAPPTAVPPTSQPATSSAAAGAHPTPVPPTAVPPTAVPPTAVPPTAVPPTAAPPPPAPPVSAPQSSTAAPPPPPAPAPPRPVAPTPVPPPPAPPKPAPAAVSAAAAPAPAPTPKPAPPTPAPAPQPPAPKPQAAAPPPSAPSTARLVAPQPTRSPAPAPARAAAALAPRPAPLAAPAAVSKPAPAPAAAPRPGQRRS
ncbi:MAG: protein kinase [Chloroflexota bacterium]